MQEAISLSVLKYPQPTLQGKLVLTYNVGEDNGCGTGTWSETLVGRSRQEVQ